MGSKSSFVVDRNPRKDQQINLLNSELFEESEQNKFEFAKGIIDESFIPIDLKDSKDARNEVLELD